MQAHVGQTRSCCSSPCTLQPPITQARSIPVCSTSLRWQDVRARRGQHVKTIAQAAAGSPAPAPAPPPVQQVSTIQTPVSNYNTIVNTGAAKAALPAWKILVGGIIAGAYISFGGFLSVSVAGMLPGVAASNPGFQKLIFGLLFPLGLVLVTICGAELYNGNTAVVTTAVLEGRATLAQALRNFVLTYSANWVGSFIVASLVAASGVMSGNPGPVAVTIAKTSMDFKAAFLRGVLCNWLVCLAVWMASSASSLGGKVIACWLPIAAFVAMGLENSIANMFFLPLGIQLGSGLTYPEVWARNLIPSTLGNTVAGIVCVALPYALLYGSLGQKLQSVFQKKE